MLWLWITLAVLAVAVLTVLLVLGGVWLHVYRHYIDYLVRIFQEKPLFIIPRGQPIPDAEEVEVATTHGLTLKGLYLPTPRPQRKGVIFFGLEYGSNRWACVAYCQFLRDAGYDIFTCELRGQGESPSHPGYQPLQWLTQFEVDDLQSAVAYLKSRHDADPEGAGFFGLSKGASGGLYVGADEPYLRCFVTDGAFAAYTTMVPYMRKWVAIYSRRKWLQDSMPGLMYVNFAWIGVRRVQKIMHCQFAHLEERMRRLAPRPLLMIHGGADNYIKPEMTQELYERAAQPKELWLVPGAKHNQAFHVANSAYQQRVLAFFDKHLGKQQPDSASSAADRDALLPIRAGVAG